MASNLGVRCYLAVFLLCAVGFQSITGEITYRNLTVEAKPFGPGSIVIQQRFNGMQDFNRWWEQYVKGFGIVMEGMEFWWGLDKVHQLTAGGDYELLIELKDEQGEYRYARYSEFVVGGEDEKYKLKKLGGYSGTAGDVNELHENDVITGREFATRDTRVCGGGWWWNECGSGLNAGWGYAATWLAWKQDPLSYTRMLIRARE